MKHSLLIFLSILALQDAHAAKIQYTEQLFGQTCFTQPVSFPTSSFTYSIAVNQYKVGAGCDPSQVLYVLLSSLSLTHTSTRNQPIPHLNTQNISSVHEKLMS